jgi:hypothetical protein
VVAVSLLVVAALLLIVRVFGLRRAEEPPRGRTALKNLHGNRYQADDLPAMLLHVASSG